MNASSKVVTFTPISLTASARDDETLMDVARRAGVPLGNACGGVGICARCKVRVLEGTESLSPPTSIETRIGSRLGFADGERMACQAVVRGNCLITATYW